uniref:Reverse transcriptase zinc-binding domain-containing protein n=1 Tax=Latimeria chalumnae TaxID=7897 RepID=H2ZY53_LATCH
SIRHVWLKSPPPPLLEVYQMLPLQVPRSVYKTIDGLISTFVWAGRRPLMSREKIQARVQQGGLRVPNFKLYHLAQELSYLFRTAGEEKDDLPPSATLEWCKARVSTCPCQVDNPVIRHARLSWSKAHAICGQSTHLNADSLLWENPAILVQGKPVLWPAWMGKGILRLDDVWGPEGLVSFVSLQEKFALVPSEFLHYLQLKNSVAQRKALTPGVMRVSLINELQRTLKDTRGMVSKVYAFLLCTKSPSWDGTRKVWEGELGFSLLEEEWGEAMASTLSSSTDLRSRLVQFKIVNRIYWTPAKLSAAKLASSDKCWRCGSEKGTLLHMIWGCVELKGFWALICQFLKDLVGLDVGNKPLACVLGVGVRDPKLSKWKAVFLKQALTTAKRIILRHWRQSEAPAYREWFLVMAETAAHERVILKLKNKLDLFEKVW